MDVNGYNFITFKQKAIINNKKKRSQSQNFTKSICMHDRYSEFHLSSIYNKLHVCSWISLFSADQFVPEQTINITFKRQKLNKTWRCQNVLGARAFPQYFVTAVPQGFDLSFHFVSSKSSLFPFSFCIFPLFSTSCLQHFVISSQPMQITHKVTFLGQSLSESGLDYCSDFWTSHSSMSLRGLKVSSMLLSLSSSSFSALIRNSWIHSFWSLTNSRK